ncbi:hypothetical protein GCM10025860_03500 [Methanobacterium ferruginis]|nr:hypothetical protein GCM10025860_03500 [Methanobacterium ferruginis]
MDTIFYLRLISGLGFLFAAFFFVYEHRKNKHKHGWLPAILLFLAGVLQLISALAYSLT